ncbi:MAG: hypothetical protein KAQ75_01690 [Bacteroidales bacterium]|nr:hypothetical protein [Bacteroidales bacterium]
MNEWKFSSYLDYAGLRNGALVNKELAFEMINYDKDDFVSQSRAIIDEQKLKSIW